MPTPSQGSRQSLRRAHQLGALAGQDGEPVGSCPYGPDLPEHRIAWLRGYVTGEDYRLAAADR